MLTLPTTLNDRYRLVEQLGVGGLADVYRAVDLVLEREVAVKVVRGATAEDEQPFAKEIAALARLSHPGIIRLYDGGTHGTTAYLVMEFVEGASLDGVIANGPLDAEQVCAIGRQVAEALAHAHDVGLVHRDVKPPNILLESSGRARLTDFGIARVIDETLTSTSLGLGTAGYLAPEQVESGKVGPPADIYSLGLVLLECLTGERAFPGTLTESTIARLHRDPPIPADLPAAWRTLLERMTHRDPRKRPTAGRVATLLGRTGELGSAHPGARSAETARTVALDRWARLRLRGASRWVAAAAALLLLTAGVLFSGSDPLTGSDDGDPVGQPPGDGDGQGEVEEQPPPESLAEAVEQLERAVRR